VERFVVLLTKGTSTARKKGVVRYPFVLKITDAKGTSCGKCSNVGCLGCQLPVSKDPINANEIFHLIIEWPHSSYDENQEANFLIHESIKTNSVPQSEKKIDR